MKRLVLVVAPALLVIAVMTGLPTMRAIAEDTNIEQMIENAKTPADHEAIAKYYDQQAAKDDEQAQLHQQQVKAYATNPRLSTMQMHCSRLIDLSKEEAKQNRALAHDHRMMAKPM